MIPTTQGYVVAPDPGRFRAILERGACAFSGCPIPGARRVRRWLLCAGHASKLEE